MSAYENKIGKDIPTNLGVCAGLGKGVKPIYAYPAEKRLSLEEKWKTAPESLLI